MINLYGFTLLRNGVKYDYSFKESLLSLAPLVKKIYLALDSGDDTSEEELKAMPFVKIIPSLWDMNLKKGLVLSVETNKALKALREDVDDLVSAWGIYLQADEVLHQDDYEILKADIEKAHNEGFDAISFRYLHFWQTHHHLAISKKWYPHEVRAIKLDSNIESWGDAQGFRNFQKIFYTEARIFHYGHVREQSSYKEKMRDMGKLYHSAADLEKRLEKGLKDARKNKCVSYFGTHPDVMRDRILRMNDIWQLPERDVVYIVGNPQKYSIHLVSQINARKVIWCESAREVPWAEKKNMVLLNPSIIDHFLKRSTTPKGMLSKHALPWSDDFRFIMQLSERGVGFKEKVHT